MAQKKNWAIFLTAALISQISTLLVYEQNIFYLFFLFPAFLYLVANKLNNILLVIALFFLAYFAGPYSLIVSIPLIFWRLGYFNTGLKIGLFLLSLNTLSSYIENFSSNEFFGINLSSIAALFLPNFSVIVFLSKKNLKPLLTFFWLNFFLFLFLLLLSINWLTPNIFASPIFRIIFLTIPYYIFYIHRLTLVTEKLTISPIKLKLIFLCVSIISFVSIFNNQKPKEIKFDESHGLWETVNAEYNPTSFGRGVNYTYSILRDYSNKLGYKTSTFNNENEDFPDKGDLFVLKMPTVSLSDNFILRLTNWVKNGGSLLVVSDHTDLYDSTQNINKLLSYNSKNLLSDKAVFDKSGLPNNPNYYLSNVIAGHMGGNDVFFPWQTGTSLDHISLISKRFISYGMSFAEHGIYSNQNRFGDFVPDLKYSYLNHTAGLAWTLGKGNIIMINDSTPWSNFSIYKSQYKHLYKSVIDIASNHNLLFVVSFLPLIILLYLLFAYYDSKNRYTGISLFLLILSISANFLFAKSTFYSDKDKQDFRTIVVTGPNTSIEFLKQIIPIGVNNYSRIVASLNKYDLDPILYTYEQVRNVNNINNNILLIEPNISQLPRNSEVFKALSSGINITILFDNEQVSNKHIQKWISELGLKINSKAMLSNEESFYPINDDFITRRSPVILKNTRYFVFPSQYSLLKFRFGDSLVQSFSVRPTNFPDTSGLLNISFSADQFSDNSIGDIWEGVRPNFNGVIREKYFSDVLLGNERILKSNNDPVRISYDKKLKKYLVLKDGSKILEGNLLNQYQQNYNPSKNIQTYISSLKDDVRYFIDNQCNSKGEFTQCAEKFIAKDLSEWFVTYRIKDKEINVIEIIRERDSRDLAYTINIIFGN